VACILSGEMLFFHSTNFLLLVIVFFVINTIYFIYQEEPYMHHRFGQDYLHYKKHVPRWIPNWNPYKKDRV
jgi:protein-S-isoprenylcysteine O-methyltransferase Ste14